MSLLEIIIMLLFFLVFMIAMIVARHFYELYHSEKNDKLFLQNRLNNQDTKQEQNIKNNIDKLLNVKYSIEQEKQHVGKLINHNEGIIELNKKILKNNEMKLFHAKETTLILYDNYKSTLNMFDNVRKRAPESIDYSLLNTLSNNFREIERYFISCFGLHPDEYKRSKKNIIGKRQGNDGNDIILNHGIN